MMLTDQLKSIFSTRSKGHMNDEPSNQSDENTITDVALTKKDIMISTDKLKRKLSIWTRWNSSDLHEKDTRSITKPKSITKALMAAI